MPIIRRKSTQSRRISPVRPVDTIEELADVDIGQPDATQDGHLLAFDAQTNKFGLISPDDYLKTTTEDGDIPDEFVEELEDDINLGALVENLDGGAF